MQTPACFFYPITTMIVDNDPDFLNSLTLALMPYVHTRSFLSPESALAFLLTNQQHHHSHFLQIDQDMLSEIHIHIDLAQIHHTVFNPKRFAHSLIAIIDYDMPTMNGLELARQLR